MLNKKIYISGQSVIASFVSIYLTQKNIWHIFDYDNIDLDSLKPTSNQLINAESQKLELPYILSEYKNNIPTFSNTLVIFYDQNLNYKTTISSKYRNPVYAIDNRIRIKSFDSKIRENARNKLLSLDKDSYLKEHSDILILGGSQNKQEFDAINFPVSKHQPKVKNFVSINLKVDDTMLTEFNGTFSFMFESIGEIICYPFLHVSNQKGICTVVNYTSDSIFDVLTGAEDGITILKELNKILERKVEFLNKLFKNATLFEDQISKAQNINYFNYPTITNHQNLVIGVGSAIMNTDPIVGQGYNLGLKLASHIVDSIETEPLNKTKIKSLINEYSLTKLTQLQKLTDIFTNGNSSNPAFGMFFSEITKNARLSAFWFEGIEDLAHYFPWIESEDATKKLIRDYTN